MFRLGLIRAVREHSHHFHMCRGVSGTEICQVATAGLKTFNQGLKLWQMQGQGPKPQKTLPPLDLDIRSPPVGAKKIPAGTSPMLYLRGLPELQGQCLDDAHLAYWCPDTHREVSITSEQDWMPYMQKAADGVAPRLVLHCKWSLKQRAEQKMGDVSEKLRQWAKSLLLKKDSPETDIENLSKELSIRNYTEFSGNGVVLEELGYDAQTWSEVVDNMELPDKLTKALKLAAKAKRGSNKVLHHNQFVNGLRTAYYLKIQVIPGEDGTIDALLAVYRFDAKEHKEGAVTDTTHEQLIKTYIELDAARLWKKEAQQFMIE